MRKRRPLVITPCSATKRRGSSLQTKVIKACKQGDVAAAWLRLLRGAQPTFRAQDLYRGRAFQTAQAAARMLEADFSVISAGLGYVKARARIPNYDLTLTSESLIGIIAGDFDPSLWWNSLKASPFASSIARDSYGRALVLVCLSRKYAQMIASDLMAINPDVLRIFGMGLQKVLPTALHRSILPYDSRLDAIGRAGVMYDFPQRALLHYVEFIRPHDCSALDAERELVTRALLNRRAKQPKARRQKVDDAIIVASIQRLMPVLGAARSRILRHLRDVDDIACEQTRFSSLFSKVLERS